MMKRILIFMMLMIGWLGSGAAADELWVIVNSKNPISAMDKAEVSALYLGRYQAYRDGSFALPLDQLADGDVRATFYQLLTGKSEVYINAYWARILFTGRAMPPRQLENDSAVLAIVQKNPSAIGYVSAGTKLTGVKVVLRL